MGNEGNEILQNGGRGTAAGTAALDWPRVSLLTPGLYWLAHRRYI